MRPFSIVIPVRASDTELLRDNLPSWLALGSDDVILCSNGALDPKLTQGCRILDSSAAEDGWYFRQGGARRLGFMNAKHDIILTGDIDLTVTPACLKAVELIHGDIGMVSLEKQRGGPGLDEAIRSLSKKMLRRVRHRMFFTGLYVLNRQAWLSTDDSLTSKRLTQETLKGEDLLLKESMLRSKWKVVYLPVVGGIDHRTALEDRPSSQLEAARRAWVDRDSPFTVAVRSLLYARPLYMGAYLDYANRSGALMRTLIRIPMDGGARVSRRLIRRRRRRDARRVR